MDDKVREAWESYLDPEIMRRRLLVASLFVGAFELAKERLVGRLRDFFAEEFDSDGPIVGDRYAAAVQSLHKNEFRAALIWHVNNGVITVAEVDGWLAARDLRNKLAHEMVAALGTPGDGFEVAFDGLVGALHQVEVWWILNVDVATDPEYDGAHVDASEVLPGAVVTLRLLRDLALAPDDEAAVYLSAFREAVEAATRR